MGFPTLNQYAVGITILTLIGSVVGIFGPRRLALITPISLLCALLSGVYAAWGAVGFWIEPGQSEILFRVLAPVGDLPAIELTSYVDRLAAFFLFLTGVFGALVALYSFGWLRDVPEKHRIAGEYNLFLALTLATIAANDLFSLMLSLEGMTLSFALLTLYRHNRYLEEPQPPLEMGAAKAAFKTYLSFSHMGAMLLLIALLVLSAVSLPIEGQGVETCQAVGQLNFSCLRQTTLPLNRLWVGSLVFLLALAGLGIKAGVIPAHVWVPLVHPNSPTTTHAFSLGVSIKVAIYLMIRVFFEFLDPVQWWWGGVVLVLAGLTALVGVYYALMGHDLKTSLAAHSVENIGIILAGIGMAMLFLGLPGGGHGVQARAIAGLALIASLYHVLNHAVFKGLLYLSTGAIENRTGSIYFDRLGGLINRFPVTSLAFLVGAVAIAGFPPLNGFISEWLTLQAVFAGRLLLTSRHSPVLLTILIFTLICLGAAFGLTALAFVKITGLTLLGPARHPATIAAARKGDVPWTMGSVQVLLAGLCFLLGLFPGTVVQVLLKIFESGSPVEPGQRLPSDLSLINQPDLFLQLGRMSLQFKLPENEPPPTTGVSSALLIFLAIFILIPLIWMSIRGWLKASGMRLASKESVTPGWTGGASYPPEKIHLTGSAFTSLIWMNFTQRGVAQQSNEQLVQPASQLEVAPGRYVREVFLVKYESALSKLIAVSERIGSAVQNGDIRSYLSYIAVVFVLFLLILLALLGGSKGL